MVIFIKQSLESETVYRVNMMRENGRKCKERNCVLYLCTRVNTENREVKVSERVSTREKSTSHQTNTTFQFQRYIKFSHKRQGVL